MNYYSVVTWHQDWSEIGLVGLKSGYFKRFVARRASGNCSR